MIANAAVQKLERYGNLGLKRSTLDQFVSFSMRDEKQSNVFALTHLTSWKECEDFFRSSPTAFVSEMLLYAMSFGVALVSQKEIRLVEGQKTSLVRTWISILSLLRRQMISDSLETTRACAHLCGTALDLVKLSISAPELELTVQLLIAALTKMSFFYAKRPQPSLFHVKSLTNVLKNRQQSPKESLFQKISHIASQVGQERPDLFVACCNVIKQLLSNRPTRLLLYYRGDESKLLLSDVKDLSECNAALFAISGPSIENADVWSTDLGNEEIVRWAHALPLLFSSFCLDSRWNVLATEQRRKVLESERVQKDRQRVKTVAGKKTNSNGSVDDGSVNDDDGRELSVIETIDTAVMSEMSAASAASFVSFMSKVDPLQRGRGEVHQHESADGNSNLPLILLEQILVTMHTILPRLPIATKILCWRQTAFMLNFLRDSITSVDREGLPAEPLFDFARDVRYNRGLGYQSLGVIFAKVIVPYFEYTGAGVKAEMGTDRFVGDCLAVFEAVAPQVIDENLSSVLTIVTAAASQDESSSPLMSFLCGVIRRLSTTNQLNRLLAALFSVFQSPQGAPAAKVFLRPNLGRSWLEQACGFTLDCEALLKDVASRVGTLVAQSGESDIACLSLCSAVVDGIRGTSLAAASVVEICAEMDLILTSQIKNMLGTGDEPKLLECALLLFSARRQVSECLLDLGVDAVDEFIETLESTLWECSSNGAAIVGDIAVDDLLSGIGHLRSKFSRASGQHCVLLLAAQRLSLCKLVCAFVGEESPDRKSLRNLAKMVVQYLSSADEKSTLDFIPFVDALCSYAPRSVVASTQNLIRTPSLRDALLGGCLVADIVEELCASAQPFADDSYSPQKVSEFLIGASTLSTLIRTSGGIPHAESVLACYSAVTASLLDGDNSCQQLVNPAVELLSDVLSLTRPSFSGTAHIFGALFSSKRQTRRLVTIARESTSVTRFIVCLSAFLASHRTEQVAADAYVLLLGAVRKELIESPETGLVLLRSIAKQQLRTRSPGKTKRSRDDAGDPDEGLWDQWTTLFSFLVDSMLPSQLTVGRKDLLEALAQCISFLFDHLVGNSRTFSVDFESLKSTVISTNPFLMTSSGAGCLWRLASLPGAKESGIPSLLVTALTDQLHNQRELHEGVIRATPTILRLHASLPNAVHLVQRALFAGVEVHQSDTALFNLVVHTLPLISGVPDVRIATFKSVIKASLEASCSSQGPPTTSLLSIWKNVSRLLLIPSGALFNDRVVESISLQFLLTVLERPVRCGVGWGDHAELWNSIIRNILSACSSTFLVHGLLLEEHAIVLPLFVTTLTEHVLLGLQHGTYTGTVASMLVSFFYRLIKTASAHVRMDELHWVICGTLSHLFQSAGSFATTFSRFSHELDSFATDIVKFLEKARLPAKDPPIRLQTLSGAPQGKVGQSGHGEHSYCDLSFVLIESEDGRNLLRDSVLRAHDQEHRVIFNTL